MAAVLPITIVLSVSVTALAIIAILGIAAIAVTSGLTVPATLRVLALGKFLVLDHHLGRVDLGTLFVDIAAGLDPAGNGDLRTFLQVLFREFSALPESDAVVSIIIAALAEPPVHGQRVPGDAGGVVARTVPDLRIPCQPAHQNNFVHTLLQSFLNCCYIQFLYQII